MSKRLKEISSSLEEYIRKLHSVGSLPTESGMAVGIFSAGTIVSQNFFGSSPGTLYPIGSLTKAFSATALLMLEGEGKLSISEPINQKAPLLPLSDAKVTSNVTIADILAHQVGLPAHDLLWLLSSFSTKELAEKLAFLDLIPDSFRQTFNYNNLLYTALGALFPQWAGQEFERFMTERILRPMGLDNTSFTVPAEPAVSNLKTATIPAAGGLFSTLQDISKWASIQLTQPPQPQTPIRGPVPFLLDGMEWLDKDLEYGFGWIMGEVGGNKFVFHPAFLEGFSHEIGFIPELDAGCVVLSNLNLSPVAGDVLRRFSELVLDCQIPAPVRPPAPVGADPATTQVAADALQFNPAYRHAAYGEIEVTRRAGQAFLRYGQHSWPLRFTSETSGSFTVPVFGIELPMTVEFSRTENTVSELHIPFSLDPRVPPIKFS